MKPGKINAPNIQEGLMGVMINSAILMAKMAKKPPAMCEDNILDPQNPLFFV